MRSDDVGLGYIWIYLWKKIHMIPYRDDTGRLDKVWNSDVLKSMEVFQLTPIWPGFHPWDFTVLLDFRLQNR